MLHLAAFHAVYRFEYVTCQITGADLKDHKELEPYALLIPNIAAKGFHILAH